MAGPQFFTPGSVHPSRPKRRFTLAEANSTLPLVKRIVTDIVRIHIDAAASHAVLERQSGGKSQQEAQGRYDAAMAKLEDCVDELTEVGCDLKDYRTGLIDFIGRHKGRDVCLCWKLGEEKVGYWHEIDAGFAGRQPVGSLEEGK